MKTKILKRFFLVLNGLFFSFLYADTIFFQDGYEAGQDFSGNFINWDETETYGGVGEAYAIDDTVITHTGKHSGRFELSDGTQGGCAYTSKVISWPTGKKLWYSCWLRNGSKEKSNVVVGGLYFMEAYVKEGPWRDRANLETHPPHMEIPDSLFMLRMAYRGRDGERHRQEENLQYIRREKWHHIVMLVDLSGENPFYAWWLNGELIWSTYDSSQGQDTFPPTEIHFGATNLDWWEGNRAEVWIDDCLVTDYYPSSSVLIDSQKIPLSLKVIPNPILRVSEIRFVIPEDGLVSMEVYDVCGREVERVFNNVFYASGIHRISLDLSKFSSGIYFFKLSAGRRELVEKVVLIK
ncbi:MAG: T9SS type A sorting domain-containing protein [candidate division WOR-3 bacterium]